MPEFPGLKGVTMLYDDIRRAKIGDTIETPNGRGVIELARGRQCDDCRCWNGDPDNWHCLALSNPNAYPPCSVLAGRGQDVIIT